MTSPDVQAMHYQHQHGLNLIFSLHDNAWILLLLFLEVPLLHPTGQHMFPDTSNNRHPECG